MIRISIQHQTIALVSGKNKATIHNAKMPKYPVLEQVARRLFSYQATSVPSERLFSAAGYTVWDRRCSLDPLTVYKIMVIKQYELKTKTLANEEDHKS